MKLAVAGAGIMGSGIAQLGAMHGLDVVLQDVHQDRLDAGLAAVQASLVKLEAKGRIDRARAERTLSRLSSTLELDEAVERADVVVEAVPEILEIKQEVLANAAGAGPDHVLLCTNTSQLSITSIGARLGPSSARLIGTHFFNPPVLMELCELVRGVATSDETVQRARDFATSLGKTIVVCQKDSPGFITTRAYAALRLECLRMADEGLATYEEIDTAMRLAFNFPMGPLELGDFNGIDTFLHAVEALEKVYGERYRPTVGLRNMVAAGMLGRKSGRGFYSYDETGRRIVDSAE